jgi:hypothetical protein
MSRFLRSPLKDKPLRLPGQSVSEEREELIEKAVGQPLTFALAFLILALLEWWRFYTNAKPSPVIYTMTALAFLIYAAFRIKRAIPKLRNLRLALEGEKAVGQFLERLRERGFQVFHDVVGTGFNIDHVVIGPQGIFTVETKTWSKPASGNAEIKFDGSTIEVIGRKLDRDPISQAKAQARWLAVTLNESTGREIAVRPVIVFPGWFVSSSFGAHKEIWVLEPKALPSFLDHEPERLSPADVKLTSYHLSRLIRAGERDK